MFNESVNARREQARKVVGLLNWIERGWSDTIPTTTGGTPDWYLDDAYDTDIAAQLRDAAAHGDKLAAYALEQLADETLTG